MRRILYASMFLAAIAISSLVGCTLSVGNQPDVVYAPAEPGPPPWAPAHGYRAKHHYYYYPDSDVYFDPGRSLYFYFSGGGWQTSVTLPREIRINVGEHVGLDMDDDRPYRYHSDIKKKYPPGQLKKKGKGKKRD